jgi:hypothetical protein
MVKNGKFSDVVTRSRDWKKRAKYIKRHRFPDGYFSIDEIRMAQTVIFQLQCDDTVTDREQRFITEVVLFHVHHGRKEPIPTPTSPEFVATEDLQMTGVKLTPETPFPMTSSILEKKIFLKPTREGTRSRPESTTFHMQGSAADTNA